MIDEDKIVFYERNGFVVVERLFSNDEVAFYLKHYMDLRAQGAHPGDSGGVDPNDDDPLLHYPRMIQMHHWDHTSLRWLLDDRIHHWLKMLLGQNPLAVQTMLYFKPPRSRGQAPHQDNFYLKVHPGNCMAAWMALDRADQDNGCLQVVPGSHTWDLLCPEKADINVSVTDIAVPLPQGAQVVPVVMEPGDVLFFNGSLVHGSDPNTTDERFRRALIGHYAEGMAQQVWHENMPVLRMDGTAVDLHNSPGGSPCGVWINRDGVPMITFTGMIATR